MNLTGMLKKKILDMIKCGGHLRTVKQESVVTLQDMLPQAGNVV